VTNPVGRGERVGNRFGSRFGELRLARSIHLPKQLGVIGQEHHQQFVLFAQRLAHDLDCSGKLSVGVEKPFLQCIQERQTIENRSNRGMFLPEGLFQRLQRTLEYLCCFAIAVLVAIDHTKAVPAQPRSAAKLCASRKAVSAGWYWACRRSRCHCAISWASRESAGPESRRNRPIVRVSIKAEETGPLAWITVLLKHGRLQIGTLPISLEIRKSCSCHEISFRIQADPDWIRN